MKIKWKVYKKKEDKPFGVAYRPLLAGVYLLLFRKAWV